MKIKLESGVIVEPMNKDVAEQYLKYGGIEVTEEVTQKKPIKKNSAE